MYLLSQLLTNEVQSRPVASGAGTGARAAVDRTVETAFLSMSHNFMHAMLRAFVPSPWIFLSQYC